MTFIPTMSLCKLLTSTVVFVGCGKMGGILLNTVMHHFDTAPTAFGSC